VNPTTEAPLARYAVGQRDDQMNRRLRNIEQRKRALSPETIATYVCSIKNFFAFLAREKIIPTNPIATVMVSRTPERVMPILTEA
jgi:site-specific recombinase XerD